MTLETQTAAALKRTRAAGRALALATSEQKNRALGILAALIRRSGEEFFPPIATTSSARASPARAAPSSSD